MNEAPAYFIWGVDWTVYGPIELITLVSWIKDERVVADTWIFSETEGAWRKAAQMPELKMFFKKTGKASSDREIRHQNQSGRPPPHQNLFGIRG
jgi:hypothetical protein